MDEHENIECRCNGDMTFPTTLHFIDPFSLKALKSFLMTSSICLFPAGVESCGLNYKQTLRISGVQSAKIYIES